MPAGTRVDKMYQALLRQGYTPKDAAKISQSKTGLSLVTGRPPRSGFQYGKRTSHGRTALGR